MESQFKTKTHEGVSPRQTSLNCSQTWLKQEGKSPESEHTCSRFSYTIPRKRKKRPPPISDEEQRLNRRQRCTLPQLPSGHCHLLQDYKHMVLGEPSDICTDCGASPQNVRHLFACTTHPTDLSPEDLWLNPVGSIRAFSYLDNGNLD